MKIGHDTKLLPLHNQDPDFAVVVIHGKDAEDSSLRWLVERWRAHMPQTLFAAPIFFSHSTEHGDGLTARTHALDDYLDTLKREFALENSRIALVGYADGAAFAINYGLSKDDAFCALIGFSCDSRFFAEAASSWKTSPPVLLVHGEKDEFVTPPEFLQTYQVLAEAQIPVSICFRPAVRREIEAFGADSAMFFLKGVQATKPPVSSRGDTLPLDRAKSIKLIIWDLDETLWSGTLDDADTIELFDFRIEAIRRLNGCGLVSAICSKNDFDTAQRKLQSLGIWDEFVFPRIAFVPKGAAIQSLITDMQLKPKNCVFIDDNSLNLAEAKNLLPDLNVIDATTAECDEFLQELMQAHATVNKSRVEEYRSLQSRVGESHSFMGSRESFLQSCDIHVAIASSSDLVDFAPRIEELINRSNQLNYLKTRVHPGSIVNFVSEASLREAFALFAWDKFGYHGLVGFIAADVRTQSLLHMAFSCRIMHMGMESVLLKEAFDRFRELKVPDTIQVNPEIPSWIKVESFGDQNIRQKVFREESSLDTRPGDAQIRFMANCQSGVFAHFSGLRDIAEIDSHPRIFVMSMVLNGSYRSQKFPPAVVHYIGSDLYSVMWPHETWEHLEAGLYEHCAIEFCDFLAAQGSRLLLVGSPKNVEIDEAHLVRGVTSHRIESFLDVWRRLSSSRAEVDFLDVDDFVDADRMVDCVHFRVDASRDIAKRISHWHSTLPSEKLADVA